MPEELIKFMKLIGRLKTTERTGWITNTKIDNPESVADHSFRATMLAWILSELKGLNTEKVMKMVLIHDTGESIIGDWDNFARKKLGEELKNKKEFEAVRKISSLLSRELQAEYLDLWNEYRSQKTEEAKLVHQVDKLELLFQIVEYKDIAKDKKAWKRMWDDVSKKITDNDLKKVVALLEKEIKQN